MNLFILARFRSTWQLTTLRFIRERLWLVLMRLELFKTFLPIVNNQIKGRVFDQFILLRNKMSKKLLYVRNWEGKIISTSSFAEEQDEELSQEPAFFMYEFLRSIIRKQCRYPFQLFKQFILFSEEDSSIEVTYKHMRYQLELIQVNINSVCNLVKQKLLIDGFLTIKHAYQKKIRVQDAYYSHENIQRIHTSITNVENLQKIWLKWQVFGKLYQNFKGFKLSKINLSKIEVINNDFTSKQLEQFQPFLNDKQNQIQVISSFIIQKSSQNVQQHQYQQEQHDVKQQQCYSGRRIQKKKEYRSYEYKNDRLTSQKSVGVNTPSVPKQYFQKQTESLEEKILITNKKQAEIIEAGSTNKHFKQNGLPQTQYIYLVRDYRKRSGNPSNYIKIPLVTENVKIVEIHTEKKKKKKKQIIQEKISLTEGACQNCKFCEQFQKRREIMKKITQRLQFIDINKNENYNQSCLEKNQIQNEQRLIRTEYIRQTAFDNEGIALFPQTMRSFGNEKDEIIKQLSVKKEIKQIRRDRDKPISSRKILDLDLGLGQVQQQGSSFKIQKNFHLKRSNLGGLRSGQKRIIFNQSKMQANQSKSTQLNLIMERSHLSQTQNLDTKVLYQSCSHQLKFNSQYKKS